MIFALTSLETYYTQKKQLKDIKKSLDCITFEVIFLPKIFLYLIELSTQYLNSVKT